MGYRQRAKEYRELQHFAEFLSDLKDQFYFCKNVTESIFRAAERMPGSLRKRLEKVCFLLEEEDMRTVLFDEPLSGSGKFLRLFLVQCRSAVQYGSGKDGTESVFVRNMTELRRDVQNECYQRQQATYLFSGMGVVTVLPVVFLPFINWFGSITMEDLQAFYEGKAGRTIVAVFILLTVGCYFLLSLVRESLFERGGTQMFFDRVSRENGIRYRIFCGLCGTVVAIFSIFFFPVESFIGKAVTFLCGAAFGIGVGIGLFKYFKYIRRLGMKGEVLGLQSMILLLTDVPNITIMQVLDILGSCGELFQKELLQCADEYAAEDVTALEQLFENAEHPAFREFAARILASERIGIKAAFEELAMDRVFFREQISLEREQEQKKKAANAQLMVFLPMAFLLFVYLIIPFLGISMKQMGNIFREMEQIRYF